MVVSWTFCTHNRPKPHIMPVCPVERMRSRVSNITHVTIFDKREHQRSAKANAATGAAIHRSDTTLAKVRFPGLLCTHTDPATITDTMSMPSTCSNPLVMTKWQGTHACVAAVR